LVLLSTEINFKPRPQNGILYKGFFLSDNHPVSLLVSKHCSKVFWRLKKRMQKFLSEKAIILRQVKGIIAIAASI